MLKYKVDLFNKNKDEIMTFYEKYFNSDKDKIISRASRVCKFCILYYMNKEHFLKFFIKMFTKTNNRIIIPKEVSNIVEQKEEKTNGTTKIKIPIGEIKTSENVLNQYQSTYEPQILNSNPNIDIYSNPYPQIDIEHNKFFYQLMNNSLLSSITNNSQILNALNNNNDDIYKYFSINTDEIEFNVQNEINQLDNMNLELQYNYYRSRETVLFFLSAIDNELYQEERNYLQKKREEYINEWNALTENVMQYQKMILFNKTLLQETLRNIVNQKDNQKLKMFSSFNQKINYNNGNGNKS